MTLWIIALVAAVVLVTGLLLLRSKRDEPAPARQPPEPERVSAVPPPAGVPISTMFSEEGDALTLESQELWLDDDEPTGPVAAFVLRAAGKTDPGKKREHNEDAFLLAPEHQLYVIADGMGGYAAGEVASALAVETLKTRFDADDHGPLDEGFPRRGAEMMSAIRDANAVIRERAREDEEKTGMGTTMVAARFSPGRNRVYIAHVGDSRCYRIRDGELRQLTHDHTLGALGITGPSAGKLSRAVGAFDQVDVDLTVDEPEQGDRYLLCSDGLFKMVPDERIASIASEGDTPDEIAARLVHAALEGGGRDNVSVIVIAVDAPR